jgi:hypothetical protein
MNGHHEAQRPSPFRANNRHEVLFDHLVGAVRVKRSRRSSGDSSMMG